MPQTSTTKILKRAREACWTALRGWTMWTTKIETYCDDDAAVKEFLREGASVSRCPMLAVKWASFDPAWWVFSMQMWSAPLAIEIYTPRDTQGLSEDLLEDAIDAIWRFPDPASTSAVPPSYVEATTGCAMAILNVVAAEAVALGEEQRQVFLKSTLTLQFKLQKDPRLRA